MIWCLIMGNGYSYICVSSLCCFVFIKAAIENVNSQLTFTPCLTSCLHPWCNQHDDANAQDELPKRDNRNTEGITNI